MSVPLTRIELGLYPSGNETFALDLRLLRPTSQAEERPLGSTQVTVSFDQNALRAVRIEPLQYGQALAGMLFASPKAAMAFDRARSGAEAVQVRLLFAPGAESLHGLAWEMLTDPADDLPLASKENVLFSRVLTSTSSRPVVLAARRELSALMMAANPTDLGALGLAAVDVPGELARVQAELGAVQCKALSGAGQPPATLNRLLDGLRAGGGKFDILYLVCHGGLLNDNYWLVLEDEQGKADRVKGETFVQALKGLESPPRLVVLSACQSAKLRGPGADTGFAASLAEAGIPAVLAMQDNFSMETAATFMPSFFRELARTGQIDQAVSVARGAVRNRFDFWVPALFTCLTNGKIWKDEGEQEPSGAKYNVTINNSQGVVNGDHNTVTQNFD